MIRAHSMAATRAPMGALVARSWTALSSVFAALRRRARYRADLAALAELDDRMLRDVGLTRADIQLAGDEGSGRCAAERLSRHVSAVLE